MVFSQVLFCLLLFASEQSRNDAATAAVLSFSLLLSLFFFHFETADVRYTPATITRFYLPTDLPKSLSLIPVNHQVRAVLAYFFDLTMVYRPMICTYQAPERDRGAQSQKRVVEGIRPGLPVLARKWSLCQRKTQNNTRDS